MLDDAAFRTMFSGSPIKRIGRDRFIRNVLIASGNSGDPGLIETVKTHLADPSPLVRGAAVWALSELLDEDQFAALQHADAAQENDAIVLTEWHNAAKNQ